MSAAGLGLCIPAAGSRLVAGIGFNVGKLRILGSLQGSVDSSISGIASKTACQNAESEIDDRWFAN